MRIHTRVLLALVISCAAAAGGSAQNVTPALSHRIDSLFTRWDNNSSPGCAVGIVRNDSLIFAKGYGMANLEYGIPITPRTIFHMASVSKQFTAYSIVLLARQGKLRFDDDIRRYLTWFPGLKEKITVRELLNHTSGIRDQWQLLAIAGTRLDDVITQDQIIKVLSRQQALNFKPGDEWNYSNSGFTLLAEIVKSVSGQTLRQFTDSAIFRPLGMTHTHFHDDYTEIEPNRAYSYERGDKGQFINAVLSYSNDGATSLFTNIEDMSKWIMNFYEPKVGDRQDIEQLTETAKLNNGRQLNYAKGIVVDSFNNERRFQHNGADAGFRTFVSVYPDLKTGFIVFSNLGNVNVQAEGQRVTSLFIPPPPGQMRKGPAPYTDSAVADINPASVASWLGFYTSDDGARFQFVVDSRRMYWLNPTGRYLLVRDGKDMARLFIDSTVRFIFSEAGNKEIVSDEYWPGNHRHLWKYDTAARPDPVLMTYTGTYYCPELDCNYRIVLKAHHLFLTNAKYDDTPLTLFGDDQLKDDLWWMSSLRMIRDSTNTIKGFEVNAGRVEHLRFNKTE